MSLMVDAEHFVRSPDWTWYILFYFFLAGLSGGSYVLAALLRLAGKPADEPAARLGFYVAFVAVLGCPVLLTLDLGRPERFWHMLVDTTPGQLGPVFKYWSPMSVGAWALVAYGLFVTLSFVDAVARDRGIRRGPFGWVGRALGGGFGRLWTFVGGLLGLFIAGYTGVLLAVSNQPVWSDTWALGGLFLASGLSGSAALLAWLVHRRADARGSIRVFERFERFFPALELVLLVLFVLLLIPPGALARAFAFPWILLWAVAIVGLLPGLGGLFASRRAAGATGGGATVNGAVAVRSTWTVALATMVVLAGILALRAAVIFSAQVSV
jgi:formate-dependent nitrite reductase membrane component NrfD